jgi:hypothetical protein
VLDDGEKTAPSLPLSDTCYDGDSKTYDTKGQMQRQPWQIGKHLLRPYDIPAHVGISKHPISNPAQLSSLGLCCMLAAPRVESVKSHKVIFSSMMLRSR